MTSQRVLAYAQWRSRSSPPADDIQFATRDGALRDAFVRHWASAARSELASSSRFAILGSLALSAGARAEIVGASFRMAEEEVHHSLLARTVLAKAGAAMRGAKVEPVEVQPGLCGGVDVALRHFLFGCCMVEAINVARLAYAIETVASPVVRWALEQTLEDELGHANIGYCFLSDSREWLDRNPEGRASIEAWLPGAFARLEKHHSGARFDGADFGRDGLDLGLPTRATYRITFHETLESAILPGLEGLGLSARSAFANRPPI